MISLNKECLLLTADLENACGYGRIIRENNKFLKIQEEKDCSDEEKKICEINGGIYLIQTGYIIGNIINITNNNNQKNIIIQIYLKVYTFENLKHRLHSLYI